MGIHWVYFNDILLINYIRHIELIMYAKSYNPRGFASLESVKSASSGKQKLRIRLPKALMNGKSPYLSLGLDDTPKNRAYGDRKVEAINADIINDCFDPTLERYQPQAKKKIEPVTPIKTVQMPNIATLYAQYIEERKEQVSPNTYAMNYLLWLKRLKNPELNEECLQVSEVGAIKLLEFYSSKYTNNANKRLFDQLTACCRWALERKTIDLLINPYEKVKSLIPKQKKKRKVPASFTKEEIGQILEAFAANQYYCHYTNYVAFLFSTGARPSEVVCLTWQDIDDRFIHFNKRMVETEKGKIVQPGLKSEDKRKFPLNNLIKSILQNQKEKALSGELIFPSPDGMMIHIQNFSRRAWKTILTELEFKYKRPYTSRSSFITHTLEHLDAKDVGRICGNLPETIYRHYAGSNVSSLIVPEIF